MRRRQKIVTVETYVIMALLSYVFLYVWDTDVSWTSLENPDWIFRLSVVPALYLAVSYIICRSLFLHAVRRTDKTVCEPNFIIVITCFAFYVISLLYTLWATSPIGPGLMEYAGMPMYDILNAVLTLAGCRLQEGISIAFGILLAFGTTGIQYAE